MKKFLAILLIAIIVCSTISDVEEFNKAEDGEVVLRGFFGIFNKLIKIAKDVCQLIDDIFGTNLAGFFNGAEGNK